MTSSKDKTEEKLAIIRNVVCGFGDRGQACLMFDTYTSEHVAALQVLSWPQAKTMIESYQVSDVSRLEGKPCWVECTSNTMLYKRAWKGYEDDDDE